MFNKYFSQIGNHEEEKFRKLETVIRKKALIRMKTHEYLEYMEVMMRLLTEQ